VTEPVRRPRRPRPARKPAAPAHKDAFFVQVAGDGDVPRFFDVSDKVGRPMPYVRPTATVAMRATDEAVAFSVLLVSNKTRQTLRELPITMPESPLARLLRKSRANSRLGPNELVCELDGATYRLSLTRDSSGCATIEDTDPERDISFVVPTGGPKLTLFLRSPVVDRVLAVSVMGARYPAPAGTNESLVRAVSMVLFNLTQLLEFRVLSGIETIDVPPAPSRWRASQPARPVYTDQDEVALTLPVWLFDGNPPQPVASGHVRVEINLRQANPATGRLLLAVTPDATVAPGFEPFRAQFERSVQHLLTAKLGDTTLGEIAVAVVLGMVEPNQVAMLSESLAELTPGLDLTTDRYRVHGS
jgi:hypothetical protein